MTDEELVNFLKEMFLKKRKYELLAEIIKMRDDFRALKGWAVRVIHSGYVSNRLYEDYKEILNEYL